MLFNKRMDTDIQKIYGKFLLDISDNAMSNL